MYDTFPGQTIHLRVDGNALGAELFTLHCFFQGHDSYNECISIISRRHRISYIQITLLAVRIRQTDIQKRYIRLINAISDEEKELFKASSCFI